jgi:hypothetical protein
MKRTAPIGDKVMGNGSKLAPIYKNLKNAAVRTRFSDNERKNGLGL